jgi:hypothetical protein
MRQRAIIGALLVVFVGVVLGATVFRTDIAQATGLATGPVVTVVNTPAQAVPVREQNLAGGNIKVHEQGTADVNVTNTAVPVNVQGTAAVRSANEEVGVSRFRQNNGNCDGTFTPCLRASSLLSNISVPLRSQQAIQRERSAPLEPSNLRATCSLSRFSRSTQTTTSQANTSTSRFQKEASWVGPFQ